MNKVILASFTATFIAGFNAPASAADLTKHQTDVVSGFVGAVLCAELTHEFEQHNATYNFELMAINYGDQIASYKAETQDILNSEVRGYRNWLETDDGLPTRLKMQAACVPMAKSQGWIN